MASMSVFRSAMFTSQSQFTSPRGRNVPWAFKLNTHTAIDEKQTPVLIIDKIFMHLIQHK
jgi:hypothetical protein